jgi:NAD(P)-dependent dehydrogenase (short-subunit alcohol dehydrogenase family)
VVGPPVIVGNGNGSTAVPTLSDRTVVVTGAGSGIGRATARLFATEGADVLVVGRRAGPLAETAQGLPGIRTLVADMTDPEAPALIADTARKESGRIDVLVNNAAITKPARLGEIDRDIAYQQIATNLIGPLFLAQEVIPHMPPGGVITNITSNPQSRGWPTNSVYGATKVGLDFLTHTWAVELGPRGIRVVSVAPGPTETPVLLNAGFSPEEVEARRRNHRIPIGRQAQPEEIAWWIVNVARPEASFLTGAVIRVDGGVSVG